ncbi:hypothetical protein GCM10010869_16510 [Mesorhizobium tianshanense]|nr:hypothetical protein GCM10010869_16510 [Mesorhizobium tianshanense]
MTWQTWIIVLKALFALDMNPTELDTFRKFTHRKNPPSRQVKEGWLVCGRRGGKSFILALLGVFIAAFHEYRQYLQPGERATVLIVAHDQRQARVIFRFISGFLHHIPMLREMVERETASSFDLCNETTIEISTASYRSVRGYAIIAFLADEIAFWPSEDSADPDIEILRAIRPAMAQFPNPLLLCASSPYARKGALYEAYTRHFGKEDDNVLVWQADTRSMNPTVPQSFIDAEMEKDPLSAAAEYLAQFRSDVETFISVEALQACVVPLTERAPRQGVRYHGFVDPSGGASDSMTLGISHLEGDKAVLDCLREVTPPFSPQNVAAEFASTLKRYGIYKIVGDRYAGEWPREQFRNFNVSYEASADAKSNIYRDLLPLLNSQQIELLNHKRLLLQLQSLERRTTRAGRDAIDHPPGSHDDLANCAAGSLLMCLASKKREVHVGIIAGTGAGGRIVWRDKEPRPRSWQRRILTPEQARQKSEAFENGPKAFRILN